MLKMKGIVGAEKGYLSEEAYIIILISYLQKTFHLTRAQTGIQPGKLVKEIQPNDKDVNLGYAFSLSGQFGKKEMNNIKATG